MTLPLAPRTLRLAASSFDRFINQTEGALTAQECSELTDLATMLRAVARGDADLYLTAFKPSPEWSTGDLAGVGDAVLAASPDVSAVAPAETSEPKSSGGGRSTCAAPPADPGYPTDPDGGLGRAAADEWVDARAYAEGMETFAHGEGNLS